MEILFCCFFLWCSYVINAGGGEGQVNGLELIIGLLGALFFFGGGAQEIFAKVLLLLLRKK